jgi:hypothetical protein
VPNQAARSRKRALLSLKIILTPHWFRRRKDGAWEEVTRNQVSRRWNATAAGLGLRIGERQEYRDPSF